MNRSLVIAVLVLIIILTPVVWEFGKEKPSLDLIPDFWLRREGEFSFSVDDRGWTSSEQIQVTVRISGEGGWTVWVERGNEPFKWKVHLLYKGEGDDDVLLRITAKSEATEKSSERVLHVHARP